MERFIRRGDIYFIARGYAVGSEQYGGRPGIVVSNNLNNRYSPTLEVVLLTTREKKPLPTHVPIYSAKYPSTALCEQIMTVSIERVENYIGTLTESEMEAVDQALMVSIDLKREQINDATLCKGRRSGENRGFSDREYVANMYRTFTR